jgi:hypothetical protein
MLSNHSTLKLTPEKLKFLIIITTGCTFAGIIWGLIYAYLGLYISVIPPFLFSISVGLALLLYKFYKTENLLANMQILMILIIPTILQWTLGGFHKSGVVILWSIVAPFGAIIFQDNARAILWTLAYGVLLAIFFYKENLYFAAFCLLLGIYLITRTSTIFEWNVDTVLIQKIELGVLYPMSTFSILFHDFLFFRKLHKVNFYFFVLCTTLSIPTIFVPIYIAEYILRFWQLSFLLIGVPLTGFLFYKAIRLKIQNAKRLFWFFISVIIAAIFDILDSLVFNTGLAFSKYAFFIYIIGLFTVLANKFVSLHNETEKLNQTLESKVEERTRELSETLSTVQMLKRQQDGDYFLTSLLIKSLTAKDTITDEVHVKFKLKQKKQFEFQKKWSEIGGDLCRSEVIKLRNKKYTVFFNADVMGKSMQGAGGALVLGAVFDGSKMPLWNCIEFLKVLMVPCLYQLSWG